MPSSASKLAIARDTEEGSRLRSRATAAALGLGKDTIAIEFSTLTVDWTKELAAEIESRGAAFLDAPVFGSRPYRQRVWR